MSVKQTAGRSVLGGIAPKFAELNDDILFGKVWSREDSVPTPNATTEWCEEVNELEYNAL